MDWKTLSAIIALFSLVLDQLQKAPLSPQGHLWVTWGISTLAIVASFFSLPKTGTTDTPKAELPDGVDETGPADDVDHEVVKEAVEGTLIKLVGKDNPVLALAVPTLADNVVKEVGRVLNRGIRFK